MAGTIGIPVRGRAMRRHTMPVLALIATAMPGAIRSQSAAPPKIDWPTYGFDTLRTSANPSETAIGPANVASLVLAWAFSPGAFENAHDPQRGAKSARLAAQAVVATSVTVGGTVHDLVLLGDNYGTFFALDANAASAAGGVLWHTALGNISQTVNGVTHYSGVRGTAALDRTANGGKGVAYVGENGMMHAMDLATGVELPGWPVSALQPNPPLTDGSIHDGVNVVNGRAYIGTAGYTNDTPPYFGRVASIDTASGSLVNTWYTMTDSATPPAASGGGIWGWGGVSIDPSATVGGVYVATGNSKGGGGQAAFAETIVNLNPDLAQVSAASPVFDRRLNGGDNDYGSTPVVFQPTGCATKLLVAENKSGRLVIDSVAANGALAVMQNLSVTSAVDGLFHGTAAWDAADQLVLVTLPLVGPSPFLAGLAAFKVNPTCGQPLLSLAWQTSTLQDGSPLVPPSNPITSPIVANGLVYFGSGATAAKYYAVAARAGVGYAAGQIIWSSVGVVGCTANVTPTIVNGLLFALCNGPASKVLAFRLPNG